MKLVIGNKNYSTWSMRPWILLDAFDVEFEECLVSLKDEGLSERLAQYSDTKRVPVLVDGDLIVWDSLAICEYVSDTYLENAAWPSDAEDRALARAVTAEMHAGFAALRNELPMNCRASRRVDLSDAAKADIRRVDQIWSSYARKDRAGQLRLFGQFSIADCFFAPVVMRFITYGVELSEQATAYLNDIRAHSSVEKWVAAGILETEIIDADEAGVER